MSAIVEWKILDNYPKDVPRARKIRSDEEVKSILLSHLRVCINALGADRFAEMQNKWTDTLANIMLIYNLDPIQAIEVLEDLGKKSEYIAQGIYMAYVPRGRWNIEIPEEYARIYDVEARRGTR